MAETASSKFTQSEDSWRRAESHDEKALAGKLAWQLGERHNEKVCFLEKLNTNVTTSSSKQFKCDLCNRVFKARKSMKNHKRDKHVQSSSQVGNSINESVTGEEELNTKATTSSSKQFKCDLCNRLFKGRKSRKNHKRDKHFQSSSKVGNSINESVQGKEELNTKATTSSSKQFKCDLCNCAFLSRKSMKNHKRDEHAQSSSKVGNSINKSVQGEADDENNPEDQDFFFCEICLKGFPVEKDHCNASSADLLVSPTDSAKEFHFCEPCDRSFASKEFYQQHRATNTHKMNFVKSRILKQIDEDKAISIDSLKNDCSKANSETLLKIAEDDSQQFDAILDEYYKNLFLSLKVQNKKEIGLGDSFQCSICKASFSGLASFTNHLIKHGRKGNLFPRD